MKFIANFYLFYFLLTSVSCGKSFLDFAQNDLFSSSYNNEPDSLNPEYYSEKGAEQLSSCRTKFEANYNRCSKFKTCNFCDANSDCGWCDEKKICLPLGLNSRNEQMIPLCMGDCQMIVKMEYCYKTLFEPQNNPKEINFSTYDQVLGFSGPKLPNGKLTIGNLRGEQQRKMDLDYKGELNLNGEEIDIHKEHQDMFNNMLESSKNIFYDLYNKNESGKGGSPIMVPEVEMNDVDYAKYLKEYIPNFEAPQFVKSDLEEYIDQVKKEKILLWLKGYSLNDNKISKFREPLLDKLPWLNEEVSRKEFLSNFLKKYMKDNPWNKKYYEELYDKLNKLDSKDPSKIDIQKVIPVNNSKNSKEQMMRGKRKEASNSGKSYSIMNEGLDLRKSSVKDSSREKSESNKDDEKVKQIEDNSEKTLENYKTVHNYKNKRVNPGILTKEDLKSILDDETKKPDENIAESVYKLLKSKSVINRNYIEPHSLMGLIQKNNMRFKQTEHNSDKKSSLKQITNKLKNILSNLD